MSWFHKEVLVNMSLYRHRTSWSGNSFLRGGCSRGWRNNKHVVFHQTGSCCCWLWTVDVRLDVPLQKQPAEAPQRGSFLFQQSKGVPPVQHFKRHLPFIKKQTGRRRPKPDKPPWTASPTRPSFVPHYIILVLMWGSWTETGSRTACARSQCACVGVCAEVSEREGGGDVL